MEIQLEEEIKKLIDQYRELSKDGWSKEEIIAFAIDIVDNLVPIVEFAKEFNFEKAGVNKKEYVINALKRIYFSIDPDIPFIPDFFGIEHKFEVMVLEEIAGPLIEGAVKLMKKVIKMFK